jgi:hypothetical protein
MITTPDSIKLKHFDEVYQNLINITNNVDEPCSLDVRIDMKHFLIALENAYNIIGKIDEEVLNEDTGNHEPT